MTLIKSEKNWKTKLLYIAINKEGDMSLFWIIFFILFLVINFFPFRRNIRHKRNIKTAKKLYIKINKINNENKGWLFSYLRKIDPFVFEELILHTFKMKGFKIKRNKKYTGDGGIDGKVVIDNQLYLIQAKRYSNFINPRHIENFASLCKSYNTKGFFIHTGKTGPESRNITKQFKNIEIISGSKLFDFFIENKEVTNDKL